MHPVWLRVQILQSNERKLTIPQAALSVGPG